MKRQTAAPVNGIAEAAFKLASMVGHKFAIVTTLSRTVPASEYLLHKYGYKHLCSGGRATDIPVPIIDGVAAAVKLAESLHQLGLKTAKTGQYGAPVNKPFIGRYEHWNR